MNYKKLTFRILSDADFVQDVFMAFLGEIGFDSFEETGRGFNAYIPADQYDVSALSDVVSRVSELNGCEISYREEDVPDQNWNAVWEQTGFEPIFIRNDIALFPTSRKSEVCTDQYRYSIELDPVQAFGSGYHQTTRMMLDFILNVDMKGKKVLDMGCGTAVLAILAKMRGASVVTAIDIDHWSTENAVRNMELNHLSDIQVVLGDADSIALLRIEYDFIFANINRNILLNDMAKYVVSLRKGGSLFMSGFFSEDLPLIDAEAARLGLSRVETKSDYNWTAACYQ